MWELVTNAHYMLSQELLREEESEMRWHYSQPGDFDYLSGVESPFWGRREKKALAK